VRQAGPIDLQVRRRDGTAQTIRDAARLLEAFFASERSSLGPDSYDVWTKDTPADEIVERDIEVLNRSFAAQIWRPALWEPLYTGSALPWLADLHTDWDLIDMPQTEWRDQRIAERVEAAVLELVSAPGRGGVAQATKLLHLKRPRLVPVLDALVRKAIAGPNVEEGPPTQRARHVRVMLEHLRAEGIRLEPELRDIQAHLRASGDGIDRTLCRILDGVLWCSQVPQWRELNKVIVRWREDDGGPATR
jgi:hypothetical protein